MHDGDSLYGAIRKRMGDAHSEGMANTSRNLWRCETEGENRSKQPALSDRVFSEILARLVSGQPRRMGVISARQKPCVPRWMISYCRRRTDRASGNLDFRLRVFLDASFINKNDSSRNTWSPITDQGRDLVGGLNVGVAGERWAVLRALADWRDADPRKRSLCRTRPT